MYTRPARVSYDAARGSVRDGFNLYYGLRSKGWRRYYWLDLRSLSEQLLRPGQRLVMVRYFTAGVFAEPGDPDKPVRQNTYLEALETLPNLHIHQGYHVAKDSNAALPAAPPGKPTKRRLPT